MKSTEDKEQADIAWTTSLQALSEQYVCKPCLNTMCACRQSGLGPGLHGQQYDGARSVCHMVHGSCLYLPLG